MYTFEQPVFPIDQPVFTYCKFAGRVEFAPINPEQIDIRDIAFHLSRRHRFNGASEVTVAVHLLCAEVVSLARGHSVRRRLHHLLHDGAETYVTDLSRPIKRQLPLFQATEMAFETAIFDKYDAHDSEGYAEIDNHLLGCEITHQFPNSTNAFTVQRVVDPLVHRLFDIMVRYTPQQVESIYKKQFYKLSHALKAEQHG